MGWRGAPAVFPPGAVVKNAVFGREQLGVIAVKVAGVMSDLDPIYDRAVLRSEVK
jgi:hypothetical protein